MSGKFQDSITEYLYDLSLDGAYDETAGEADGIGWHALYRGACPVDDDRDSAESMNHDDRTELAQCIGAIIREDSQGFVDSVLYSSIDLLNADWQAILDDDERYHAEPSDDD